MIGILNFLNAQKMKAADEINATNAALALEKNNIKPNTKDKISHSNFFLLFLEIERNIIKETIKAIPAYLPNPVGLVPAIPNKLLCALMVPSDSYGLCEQIKEFKDNDWLIPV